ncbi:MAG: multiheme c-type cytochrome, partial [Longimicrobiales bacterium]|nr:multiheme c-type cytochrome [Longimicrobiales bacterium]
MKKHEMIHGSLPGLFVLALLTFPIAPVTPETALGTRIGAAVGAWVGPAAVVAQEAGPVESSVREGVPSDPDAYAGYAHTPLFRTSDRCMSCHNDVVGPDGMDLSIGFDWRASMMANSARDPYWQAAVRREVLDHPSVSEAIQNECAKCHMPMASYEARAAGEELGVFAHLPSNPMRTRADTLAADGVSCTLCHQIQPDNLGTEESMVGGFRIDRTTAWGERRLFGPFQVDSGRVTIMHSSARYEPVEGDHIQSSELCATCHTLRTHAFGPGGEVIGELPEQVPYQEWAHSDYAGEQSCQSCHMPVVEDSIPVTGVLGVER